ncbi:MULTISPECIES: acyl-CoA dehydrogenase family protein [unclassified Moorena]|uniref:acyl-CoA dehydrogenase family protein n=1 Tax=unclassified Moorena TaxID=2683338 RepID=UPI0013CAB36C|nr:MULTISPECIES: acyl-CoA dehydrogenase family protein [unclassified Moorena]NEO12280.1 acyl-CoA dehydrogenase [Moorena sp. SIO3E8]NEO88802.1 acyl-CoA dehydrogenase [Moorena sp. SIO3G5]NEP98923.1 acyl-CoA dehydrogenase [Moorena sp. SIO3F7]
MDFAWNSQQIAFKRKVIRFAQQSLTSDLIKQDKEEIFNRDGWQKCCEFGIHGWPIPCRYGGQELDILTIACALQGLGYGCKDNGLIFGMNAHIWAGEMPLLTFGSEEQKEKYLPLLCREGWIASHAASEPQAGSDIYSLKTTAQKDGDKYILNGHKHYVTNGTVADLFIIFANVDPSLGKEGLTAFIIEKDTPGLVVQKTTSTMGVRTAQVAELKLENCEVSASHRLGKEGAGLAIFNHSMEWERGFILASAVGTMERLLEQSIRYARTHKQFGQAIGKFQLVANKLVDMKLRLESAKAHLYKVAWMKEHQKMALMEASIANLYISEAWVKSALEAIEVHGAYGYLTNTELERELRDAIGSKFYSGTSEIQRVVIGKFLGL